MKSIRLLLLSSFMLLACLQASAQFVTTWETDFAGQVITIPTFSGETYNYNVDWGDGQMSMNQTGDVAHTYAAKTTYTVTITGAFPRFYVNDGNAKFNLRSIEAWGNNAWTSMNGAFYGSVALVYNATDTPDLSGVTDMSNMFRRCATFNGDIGSWNVSTVTNMSNLLRDASVFNQSLGGWNVSAVTDMTSMLSNTGLGSVNYDNTLSAWATLGLQNNVTLNTSAGYCFSESARQSIIDNFSWTISDAGASCSDASFFKMSWQTTAANESITIPTFSGETYNYQVNWGDGQISASHTGDATHMYTSAGTYTVSISGTFPRIYFNNSGDRTKIQSVTQWGTRAWTSMENALYGCTNVQDNSFSGPPNLSSASSLAGMFRDCTNYTGNVSSWDVSTITDMNNLFNGCSSFNGFTNSWNVANVTNMSGLFANATTFNRDISTWNISNVVAMDSMFAGAQAFDQDISGWNVGKVTSMAHVFEGDTSFNKNLGTWNISGVTNMTSMFDSSGLSLQNYDTTLIAWAAQSVQNNVALGASTTSYCFSATARQSLIDNFSWTITDAGTSCNDASYFITTWQTTVANDTITIPTFSGETYNYMINWGDGTSSINVPGDTSHIYATVGTYTIAITDTFPRIYFNNAGDTANIRTIEQWGTGAWTSMTNAFHGCNNLTYNATDLPNLSAATSMSSMFQGCTSVNGAISTWNVSTITDMSNLFEGATAFNQDLGAWNISAVITMASMFNNSGLTGNNYDNILIAWAAQSVQNNVSLGATVSYCFGAAARQSLITTSTWSITDAGKSCNDAAYFVTTWQTTTPNESITIPTFLGETYNYNVDWGDTEGSIGVTGDASHTYTTAGTYTITVTGTFPRIYFNNGGDRTKLQTIEQWGNNGWTSMGGAFYGCNAMTYNATDLPSLASVTSMDSMFQDCAAFNGAIDTWNVSTITGMSNLFNGCSVFNQSLASWDVSAVSNMSGMFQSCSAFNQGLNTWNVSAVTNMSNLFNGCSVFNQSLPSWDVNSVTDMSNLFNGCSAFNQSLTSWNVSNVTNMSGLFQSCSVFNQNIDAWNTASVIDMDNLFNGCSVYNQPLSSWNVSNDTTMSGLFQSCTAFNQNIDAWNVSSVTDMSNLFNSATAFNQPLASWNVSHVKDMSQLFRLTNFNQDITTWQTDSLRNMSGMFNSNGSFNQAIGSWNVSQVTDMSETFFSAQSFSQDLSAWNTANVTTMARMFNTAQFFNGNISTWDVSKVTDMTNMFRFTLFFNQDLSTWDVSKVQTMSGMFSFADAFNGNIGSWNTASLANMSSMFAACLTFNQDLGSWNVTQVTDATNMFVSTAMNDLNYDKLLKGWARQAVQSNVTFGASGINYCNAGSFRQTLISTYTWAITDAGQNCATAESSFNTTWQTTTANEAISIPLGGSNINVDWGDGTTQTGLAGTLSHTYVSAGTYVVKITGEVTNCDIASAQLQSIDQWGTIGWTTMSGAFQLCTNLTLTAIDAPDLASVTNLRAMFDGCTSFVGNSSMNNWNTSAITDMAFMFQNATVFNAPIGNWDMSNVSEPQSMFSGAAAFNQPIGSWNTAKFNSMESMFLGAVAFNQPIGNWKCRPINLNNIFNGASAFNQDIGNWSTGNSSQGFNIFNGASSFNQDISNWDVSGMTNLIGVFNGASSFDQNLGAWAISNNALNFTMLANSGMSTTNYDLTLQGWAAQGVTGVSFGTQTGLTYCDGAAARAALIAAGWTINGDALACPTVTTWDGAAWDNGAPTSSVDSVINGNYDAGTNGNITCIDLTINAAMTLTVPDGNTVTIDGNLANNGAIVVQETGVFVQTLETPGNSGAGTYTVERTGANSSLQYNYWSSPVTGLTLHDAFATNASAMYAYDATGQAWTTETTASNMATAQGFAVAGVNPVSTILRTFSNTAGFHTGRYSNTLGYSDDADATNDWNLIGNPYPSGINVASFLNDNYAGGTGTINNAVYLWNSDGNDVGGTSADYAVMNIAGVANGGAGTAPTSADIASCQGFFVQAVNSGSVLFKNTHRTTTNNTFVRVKDITADWQRAWIKVSLSNEFEGVKADNEVLIGFMPDAKTSKDHYDAIKFSGNEHVSLYTQFPDAAGKDKARLVSPRYAIQGLPSLTDNGQTIPLGLSAKTEGEFTFQINHLERFDEVDIYLYDALTRELINLRTGNYTVDLAEGDYTERFSLRFAPSRVTSIEDELKAVGIQLSALNQQIHIQYGDATQAESTIAVYDLMGRQLVKVSNSKDLSLTIPMQQTGIYIVRVENQFGVVAKKVWLR